MPSDIVSSNVVEFAVAQPKHKPIPSERTKKDEDLLDSISDLWNAWAVKHGSPSVRFLTASRATHCRRRIDDLKQATGFEANEAFQALLAKCSDSFFVKGDARKPLAFDQLMQESFMVRMMEGEFTYRGRR